MIASISTVTDPLHAVVRPTADDAPKRREALPSQGGSGTAVEGDSAVVEISSEGARRAAQATAPKAEAGKTEVSAAVTESSASRVKKFSDADANQDGRVTILEARAYDFAHPSIPAPQLDGEVAVSRSANADVKAYEAVARSGRSL